MYRKLKMGEEKLKKDIMNSRGIVNFKPVLISGIILYYNLEFSSLKEIEA